MSAFFDSTNATTGVGVLRYSATNATFANRRRGDVLYVTATASVSYFDPLPAPKWWRWFDAFRESVERFTAVVMREAVQRLHRQQERFPLSERRRRKRRLYLAQLRVA